MNPLPTLQEVKEQEIEEQVLCLRDQGFPKALARAMCLQTPRAFPLRLWVVDNSGSMKEVDGRRLVPSSTKTNVQWTTCTRWDELKDTVTYHAQLAGLLQARTQFRLLNPPPVGLHPMMGVAERGPDMVDEDLHSLRHTLNSTHPGGDTPLARHLHNVYALVSSMRSELEKEGQHVVVVLATDGVPTDDSGHAGLDGDFEWALQRLQGLPVWVIVRLCTNDERVVQYYRKLDNRHEWNLEVLDDFVDEAKEVNSYNPWLNYGLPLHRCREWGFPSRLFDLLDERTLTLEEMSNFMQLVFADRYDYLPDPAIDWKEFVKRVRNMINQEEKPWDPVKKRPAPWIDLRQLERTYGPNRHGQQRMIMMASAFVAVCVLWSVTSKIMHKLWHNSPIAPSPSPAPLTETAIIMPSTNGLIWILGGVLLMAMYLPRGPPNTRLVLALLGVMLALALPSLWGKSAAFWKGAGWIVGGMAMLFLVAAFNDR